ncbi:MAG: hypothetical protein PHI34_05975 [Acidobacteriota bacterium]|nr:hypothetical protein [Acidobacteriota bacterium]
MTADLVSTWFQTNAIAPPRLDRRALFRLPGADLDLRTNDAELRAGLMETLTHHLVRSPLRSDERPAPVRLELSSVTGEQAPRGILFPLKRSGGEWTRLPARAGAERGSRFVHFRLGGTEALWRPIDMLAAFSPGGGTLKILALQGAPKTRLLHARPGAIAKIGIEIDVLVNLILILHVRAFGMFCLHAASLADRGRGVLLVGPSGCGKTTTAAALMRGGFTLLSDEITAVAAGGDGETRIEGILFPPRLCGPAKPELETLEAGLGFERTDNKHALRLEPAIARRGIGRAVPPRAVLFLELPAGRPSRHELIPADEGEGFERLLGQVLDPTMAAQPQRILVGLCALLDGCPYYRLRLGTDLGSLPELVRGALASR